MNARAMFLVVACLVAVSSAPMAGAAEGLYLTWNDCAASMAASPSAIFDCASNSGESDLFCAFTLSQPVDSVLALEIVVDLQSAAAALPDWWHSEPGGCRESLLQADDDFSGRGGCVDFWQGGTSGGLQTYMPGFPRGQANQARLKIALAVPSAESRSLNATDMYYAARIVVGYGKTTGSSACVGCEAGACLVLNSILIKRPPRPEGAPSTNVFLTTPGTGGANWALWQPGGANCLAVPVRTSTWGALKALYR